MDRPAGSFVIGKDGKPQPNPQDEAMQVRTEASDAAEEKNQEVKNNAKK